MSHRTTLVLDERAQKAAKALARHYDCSVSEAVRRAVVRHCDVVLGVPAVSREQRKVALTRLIDLFEGHDAGAEIRGLKLEDEGF